MGGQLAVMAIKSAFFEYLSKQRRQRSIDEIIESLVSVLKRELCMNHAVFYTYNEQLDDLNSHINAEHCFPLKSLPYDLQYGKMCEFEGRFLIPIIQNDTLYGLIELKGIDQNRFSSTSLDEIAEACSSFYTYSLNLVQVTQNEQKYEQLYRLTEKFHSYMNKDDVLLELITTLQCMYSEYIFYLFLSHDNENQLDLPIKDLGFDCQGNEMAMEAYVTGKVQLSIDKKNMQTMLYTPLKGKQGVYGVLQVVANHGVELEGRNQNFITLLANAAGTALENAQLYEQSKRLIKDLQLINETSHRLNKNLRLTETMTYLSTRIMNSFDAGEVGFFYINHNGSIQIFPGSTSFFNTEEVDVYIQYIREKIEKDLEGLFIGDIKPNLADVRYSSVMAVPMIQSDSLKGFALVLHKNAYHFSFDMFKLLQSLIHHSTLALTNTLLREELETLVKTDHLTQLFSRNYFNDCIEHSMQMDRQGTFVLIDIDNFKKINDTYGHQIGDEVLVQVANIIRSNIRENDVGARWGGEELAVYLPQVDLEAGITVAERIVKRVRENTSPMITISCGVSYWNAEEDRNFIKLFSRADKALYVAKNEGKNQVIIQEEVY